VQAGASWKPVPGCDQSSTSCRVTLQAPANLYVIAVNNSVAPPKQTPQLFGCYPSTGPCGAPSPPRAGRQCDRHHVLGANVFTFANYRHPRPATTATPATPTATRPPATATPAGPVAGRG
jgi:hypothetical protein